MFKKEVRYIFLTVLTVISLMACGKDEEVPTIQKPEQELMFLLKYDNWSEEEIHSASVIATDGRIIKVPDDILGKDGDMSENWAEQLIQLSENDDSESTIPEEDLAIMYNFVNNADIPNVPVFKEFAETVYDAGFETLYLLEKTDGSYTQQKLCVSGQENKYIDDEEIIDFCNFMSDKHYFAMYIG